MNKTKVFGIRDTDFDKFINKINDFYENHNVFATQTHINSLGAYTLFSAIIYYEPLEKSTIPTPPFLDNPKVPTPLTPPTPKQIRVIVEHKLPIPQSKKAASIIIDNIAKTEKWKQTTQR